jgi:hypothetical protein
MLLNLNDLKDRNQPFFLLGKRRIKAFIKMGKQTPLY